MLDDTTLVLRFPDLGSLNPATVSVTVTPISESEPLIRSQPPIFGGDRAGS